MYKNKAKDGSNNIIGKTLRKIRVERDLSQNGLAKLLQVEGLDIDKNAIQRIESGSRFVTDIKLVAICKTLKIRYSDLLEG